MPDVLPPVAVSDIRSDWPFLPAFYKAGKLPERTMFKGGSDLRDSEIGVFTAWDARAIATSDQADIDRLLALTEATYSHHDWDKNGDLFKGYWQVAEGEYFGGWSSSHYPNVFFLPLLLTGDLKYIKPIERIYEAYQSLRQKHIEGPIVPMNGRNLAWNLRTLFQLAWLQARGYPVSHDYLKALDATRQRLLNEMQRPKQQPLHVLGIKINTDDAFTSWMEGYIGVVINYGCLLGFEKWREIAEWHFQQLIMRTDGTLPLKYLDNDHCRAADTLDGYVLHNATRMALLTDWPDDKLPPLKIAGEFITYQIRAQIARGWAGMAEQNRIAGAWQVMNRIDTAISERGDTVFYQEWAMGVGS